MAFFEARGLAVSYRRNGVPFEPFSDVGFELFEGQIADLVGPSGSGKSSLLCACARLLPKTSGTLALRGVDSKSFSPEEWRRRVCYVPQKPTVVAGTVRDNLLLPWSLRVRRGDKAPSDEALRSLIAEAALGDVDLDRDAAQLSGGELARVALLRAFATRPDVLLLDEVDAALDADSAGSVSRLTRRLVRGDTACLRIRHRPPDGAADRTLRLERGKIAQVDHAEAGA
ncbi:ABC transporter ATP-binding protein [Xiamenia xianingshaonis]|uniref:ATP-binding cassette domain-containing protein n=1 Tax=Xiamenia xianingshaonis TaxID=2682776 RepID=A0ABX0IIE1_9ACTN|nr:ATP-binding cassette domain-containing protein [Xiamenia xianingshaonis]NHM13581.1 ATP-binding cassette domain-containing protein [Xiamenia xianingshaonis]